MRDNKQNFNCNHQAVDEQRGLVSTYNRYWSISTWERLYTLSRDLKPSLEVWVLAQKRSSSLTLGFLPFCW